jgi:hypothetical protein
MYWYHDLQCRSGLGDRFLDVWAALTLARLHDAGAHLFIGWHPGRSFASFVGDYGISAFSLAGCSFADQPPPGALAMPAQFSHTALNACGVVPLPGGALQLVLRTGMIWGNSSPERLHADLAFYGLDPAIPLQAVIAAYRGAAAGTRAAAGLEAALPQDLCRRVGVHLRLGDKLVPDETDIDMSPRTWRRIEGETVAYLERCIAAGHSIFVCGDSPPYQAALVEHLRALGGDVATAEAGRLPPPALVGGGALLDFFALTRCALIVQMTKYSTFSMAAALAGNLPLVNFQRGAASRLDLWRSALFAAG